MMKSYLGLSFLGAAILIAASFCFKPLSSSEARLYISPPPNLTYFSFGQQFAISDSIWIRAIADIDFCSSDASPKICNSQNWLFHMLDQITQLGPDNLEAYHAGGLALSVLLSDIFGASVIFDRGLAVIATDWNLYYRAAYHSLIEEKDKKKAAGRFLAAAKILGSKGEWFYNIAGRLYNEEGEKQIAVEIYDHMKSVGVEEGFLKRMREKIGIPGESP